MGAMGDVMKRVDKGIFEEQPLPDEAWESAAPLIDHLISNYHHPLVVILRKLQVSIREAVQNAFGEQKHKFVMLQTCFSELCVSLAMQMIKEDGNLFPMIRRLEEHRIQGCQTNGLGMDIGTHIRIARAEYAQVCKLLDRFRFLIPLFPYVIPPIAPFFELTDGHIRRQLHLKDRVLFCIVEDWLSGQSNCA